MAICQIYNQHHQVSYYLNLSITMASSLNCIFLTFSLLFSLIHAGKPKALLIPVTKDTTTLQYTTHLNIGTPPLRKTIVVDLANRYTWLDCLNNPKSISSTYKPGICGSQACSKGKYQGCGFCTTPIGPSCNNKTCLLVAKNPISDQSDYGTLSTDTIYLQSIYGSKSKPFASFSNYIFDCTFNASKLLPQLAKGAQGMLGLGRHPASLPLQLSSGGSFGRKFAVCLPSDSKSNGVILFGDSPYVFYPNYNKLKSIDYSKEFAYTKLFISPVSLAVVYQDGEPSAEYFVKISSIKVDGKPIPMNTTLIEVDSRGIGGVTISTVTPYTLLETTIYKALVQVFDDTIISQWNVSKVKAVAPFNDCYTLGNMGTTPLGIGVPDIDVVFENKNEVWTLYGANSMVEVSKDVVCLGFLDGGFDVPRASIVIGAHQMENYLLEFDLGASKLGFTSALLLGDVECSNYKLSS